MGIFSPLQSPYICQTGFLSRYLQMAGVMGLCDVDFRKRLCRDTAWAWGMETAQQGEGVLKKTTPGTVQSWNYLCRMLVHSKFFKVRRVSWTCPLDGDAAGKRLVNKERVRAACQVEVTVQPSLGMTESWKWKGVCAQNSSWAVRPPVSSLMLASSGKSWEVAFF